MKSLKQWVQLMNLELEDFLFGKPGSFSLNEEILKSPKELDPRLQYTPDNSNLQGTNENILSYRMFNFSGHPIIQALGKVKLVRVTVLHDLFNCHNTVKMVRFK